MKNKIFKACSLVTALAFIVSTNASALSYAYSLRQEISHGTTYVSVSGEGLKGSQKANYIEYMPNQYTKPIAVYGNKLYGLSTFSQAAAYLENQGLKVMGGINGDYFVTNTGLPIGLVIREGELMSSDAWQNAVGFTANGSAVIGRPGASMSIAGTSATVNIDYFNKSRSTAGVYLFNTNFNGSTKITTMGTDIVFEKQDDTVLKYGNSLKLTVVAIEETNTAREIAPNQYVLSIDKMGPIAKLPKFTVGETVTLTTGTTDPKWRDVQYAVGGKEMLIDNNIVTPKLDNVTINPRTAVGIKYDGSVILYTVDGRQSGVSAGLTLKELATELQNMGCLTAINLDGGASSIIAGQKAGSETFSILNKPSGGSQRPSANFIMLVNTMPKTGITSKLVPVPEANFMLLGAKMNLTAKAMDEHYYAAPLPESVILSSLNGLGSVTENKFYVAQREGVGEIEARNATGSIKGTATVQILTQIDRMSLSTATAADIKDLNISMGKSMDINATVGYKNMDLKANDTLFKWTVEGGIGTVNNEGIFTAGNQLGEGKLVVTHNNFKKEIPINVGLEEMKNITPILDFETEGQLTSNDDVKFSSEKDIAMVKFGVTSQKIAYNYGDLFSLLHLNSREITISPLFKNLGLSVYGDGSGSILSAHFKDEAGLEQKVSLGTIDFEGYRNLFIALPEKTKSFTGFSLEKGRSTSGTIYMDQVYVSEAALPDEIAPSIEVIEVPDGGDSESNVTVKLKITDNGGASYLIDRFIKVDLNGTPLKFDNIKRSGTVVITIPKLSHEINRLTVEARDGTGNIARRAFDIPLSNVTTNAFADTAGHWAVSYINYANQFSLIKGQASGDRMIFRPEDNLTRAEFAVIMARYLGLPTDLPATVEEKKPVEEKPEVEAPLTGDTIPEGDRIVINDGTKTDETKTDETKTDETKTDETKPEDKPAETPVEKPDTKAYLPFEDANEIPTWALGAVKSIYEKGIINGSIKDDKLYFNPKNNITRAEVAAIIGRTFESGYQLNPMSFADDKKIPAWAQPQLQLLVSLEILGGYADNTIRPENKIKRSEIAKILYAI